MRATTIGTVTPITGQLYTASDILQTNPAIITNPTYLSSAGIQLGPGTDLINKTAGGKGFSTYTYLTNLYYFQFEWRCAARYNYYSKSSLSQRRRPCSSF